MCPVSLLLLRSALSIELSCLSSTGEAEAGGLSFVILTYVCRLDVFHDNYKYVVERFFQTLPYGFFEGMMGRCEILIRLLLDKFDTFYHTYDCLDDSYRKLFGAISA